MKKLLPALFLTALLFAPVAHAIAQPSTNVAAVGPDGARLSTPEAQSPVKNQQEKDESDEYRHRRRDVGIGETPDETLHGCPFGGNETIRSMVALVTVDRYLLKWVREAVEKIR